MMAADSSFCPYVGLDPYTEELHRYFFGRERDQRIITSNLYAAPLTVLYGASGVGKSSVLLAGVVPHLRAAPRTAVFVYREWQDSEFLTKLKSECLKAVELAHQKPLTIDLALPFDELLYEATQEFRGTIIIVLDQFEEYFLYHPETQANNTFDAEFARAVNREEVDASFLIVLREDGLSKLDRFRARIPNLLGNTLRLHHLDAAAAEKAIREPLKVYNVEFSQEPAPMDIKEDDLVREIIAQVKTGQVKLGQLTGAGRIKQDEDIVQIETPFLQLVMTRLWDEEVKAKSHVLRLGTFKRLGGAQEIVQMHLDGTMQKLKVPEKEVCAQSFDRLVTPSGEKIACSVEDLTEWAGNLAKHVPTVIKILSENRILRNVAAAPDQPAAQRYEIFHDVLATAILDWKALFAQNQTQAREKKRRRLRLLQAFAVVVIIFGIISYRYYSLWLENRPWGYVRNLSTGTVHLFKGASVSLGRSTEYLDYQNTVNLRPNLVSRIHLLVSRNLSAIDMRSLNGTTVNSEILPYGDTKKLDDGDIIVLADIAPFQFYKIKYFPYQFWSPSIKSSPSPAGWGMLIDTKSKTTTYLSGNRYFLSHDRKGKLIARQSRADDYLLMIRLHDKYIYIEDRDDGNDLWALMKMGDYTYRECKVPPGKEFPVLKWRTMQCKRIIGRDDYQEQEKNVHAAFQAIFFMADDIQFRIIPIWPDLEASTDQR